MQRILDIDLDFFLADCCPLAAPGERPALCGHEPWTPEETKSFLESQCRLNEDIPLPGKIFTTHDEALQWWRQLINAGKLIPPFHVTHIDAHSDLGIGKPGPGYVLYNVLAKPPAKRWNLEEFYTAGQLDEANYLLFALATAASEFLIMYAIPNHGRIYRKGSCCGICRVPAGLFVCPRLFPACLKRTTDPSRKFPSGYMRIIRIFGLLPPMTLYLWLFPPAIPPKKPIRCCRCLTGI